MREFAIFLILFAVVVFIILVFRTIFGRSSKRQRPEVRRENANPMIKPGDHDWRARGAFNPAAIQDSTGRVHMLYRAVGGDGLSRLSYASSESGASIDDSLPYPVFAIENPRQNRDEDGPSGRIRHYDPVMYPSGGSWGGVEDPRMVSIDGTIYVTFNAFDGWDYLRVGITSISEDDFFHKRFTWSKPELISPKGKLNKNWMLFPEKINGKFAILHSINPKVQIEYVGRLEEITKGSRTIESTYGGGRPGKGWDTWVRSAGPPPVKTDRGWLVLYHAIDKRESHKYKLGAMLLDLKDPTKIIARAPSPILEPEMWYENDWKPGIVYACGALVKKGELYIYYGGGDKHVCAAHTPIKPLLDWMLKNKNA
ncbi:MAG: hypothetical protein KGI79_03005 [Patescibacteria group bacterium]|nr:hypothetical protein [Patescibacteria group bacterium]MDE2116818.1 hypothetical protein [Patescibacteria group bacterium]